MDTLCLLLANLQLCPGIVCASISKELYNHFIHLEILKIGLYTCVTLANISLVHPNKLFWQALIIQNHLLPHGLEFLLAEVASQFVIQNSKPIKSHNNECPCWIQNPLLWDQHKGYYYYCKLYLCREIQISKINRIVFASIIILLRFNPWCAYN